MRAARFNPLIETLSPPPVPSVQAWGRIYDGALGSLIDLSQAVPGYPPHADMLTWLGEAASSRTSTGYGPIEGEMVLRQAYSEHVSGLYGGGLKPANIHITSGCNQAFICAAMTVAGSGDTVLMTNPFYFNHDTTLSMLGIRTRLVECDPENGFLPDPEALETALSTGVRALALVTPNNPTGAVYPAGLLKRIYDLCRKNGVWLILDETYRDFLSVGAKVPHDLFSQDGWEDTLVQLYSFSKSFCIPGHRLGAITAGAAFVEQVAKIMDNLQICAPRAGQFAVARALPALVAWREENRQEIETRARALRAAMQSLPAWTIEAIGAYFAYIRHPFAGASTAVAEALAKKAGILCIPGEYFGNGQEPFLRFAFANADAATIGGLHERLAGFSFQGA